MTSLIIINIIRSSVVLFYNFTLTNSFHVNSGPNILYVSINQSDVRFYEELLFRYIGTQDTEGFVRKLIETSHCAPETISLFRYVSYHYLLSTQHYLC